MKIKLFENFTENDNYKNKILLIDASASFQHDVLEVIKENLYLTPLFRVIFASYHIAIFKDINLDKLSDLVTKYRGYSGDGMQNGIDFIIKNELEGAILLVTDGMIDINLSELSNDISIITTTYSKPSVIGGNYELFYNKIDQRYYPPRDCKSLDEYEAYKMSKKYNI